MTQEQIQYLITYVHDKSGVNNVVKGNKAIEKSIFTLAKRAMMTIPIWMALRTTFMGLLRTVGGGVKYIADFDKALARASAVTHGVKDVQKFIVNLREDIQELAIKTGVSVDKIAEGFYRFGTAGSN